MIQHQHLEHSLLHMKVEMLVLLSYLVLTLDLQLHLVTMKVLILVTTITDHLKIKIQIILMNQIQIQIQMKEMINLELLRKIHLSNLETRSNLTKMVQPTLKIYLLKLIKVRSPLSMKMLISKMLLKNLMINQQLYWTIRQTNKKYICTTSIACAILVVVYPFIYFLNHIL